MSNPINTLLSLRRIALTSPRQNSAQESRRMRLEGYYPIVVTSILVFTIMNSDPSYLHLLAQQDHTFYKPVFSILNQ
jgi:hypothetical protein